MHLGIDFWKDLEGFWEPIWSHVGTQIDQKSMWLTKNGFSKNHCFSWGKTTIFKVRGVQDESKNRSKIYQKGAQHGKASWHRFLSDFGGFWEASWGRKSSKNRSKKASKKWWQKEGHQDGKKIALFNSSGHLELSIYKSNPVTSGGANSLFGLSYGDNISIIFDN